MKYWLLHANSQFMDCDIPPYTYIYIYIIYIYISTTCACNSVYTGQCNPKLAALKPLGFWWCVLVLNGRCGRVFHGFPLLVPLVDGPRTGDGQQNIQQLTPSTSFGPTWLTLGIWYNLVRIWDVFRMHMTYIWSQDERFLAKGVPSHVSCICMHKGFRNVRV